ncbi:MAG: hypothetical protein MRY59_12280 [Aquisalinus sp.]|nr:hypothetical protein [Aquisalinus sp.]
MDRSTELLVRNVPIGILIITLFYWSGKFCGEVLYLAEHDAAFTKPLIVSLLLFAAGAALLTKTVQYLASENKNLAA